MKLVLITQNGCVPCTMVKNYLIDNEVEFDYVNVSDFPERIEEFNIMSTPTAILIDEDGEEVTRVSGFNPPMLDTLISNL